MSEIRNIFPCFYKKCYKDTTSNKPMSSFMNSALNIEYVYLIIFGVSELYNLKESQYLKIKKIGKDIEIFFDKINS